MSRYIDANALKEKIDKSIFDADDKEWYLTLLVYAPSIDIVCCSECMYSNGMGQYCQNDYFVDEDTFCSYGERKESK